MLTKADIVVVKKIVKDELEPIEQKISHLPTKDEFYKAMDQVMGELKAIREEHTVESYRVGSHEERITALESLHPGGRHVC